MNDWLFAQYDLMGPCRILELGCGNAAQWEGRLVSSQRFSFGAIGFFSGYGGGRLEKFESFSNVLVQQIDIQEIPFPDAPLIKSLQTICCIMCPIFPKR